MTAVPMAGAGDNGNDPVSALADLFDVMDGRIRKTDALARRSESNRLSILYVHALFALLIAPTFAALGKEGMTSSIWALIKQMPGTPGSLALIMFLGGLILAILIMWYGTISFSFAVGIIVWLLGGGDGPRPGLYAPLVYAHFAVIMLVHCNTLRRMMVASGRYG
jgi:hypothetical protein